MRKITCIGSILFVLALSASATHGQTLISWTPSTLSAPVLRGTVKVVAVTFVANSNLTNVDVSVVPELRPFLSVSPQHFDSIRMNTSASLTVTISILEAAISQVYTGTIQLRSSSSGSVFARPLPVALLVQPPTSNSIPDGVALPSADRYLSDRGIQFAKDEVIIFADPAATQGQIMSLAARFGAAFLGNDSGLRFYQLQLAAQNLDTVLALVSQLENDPIVKLATPHYFLSATTPIVPNDPSWDLFGIFNICPTAPRYCESWAQALIQLPDAWSVNPGSSSVKIAIVDQGFDPNHEDLKVDNVLSDVQFSVDPFRAHGTAVASLAAAVGNNGKGLAGAMWTSDLLLFGCSNGLNDKLDEPTCWKRAREAIDNGARIINASLGHNFSPICDGVSPLTDAERQHAFDTDMSGWRMVIDYATATPGGVLFVFTAGNDATSFDWESPGALSADNPNLTTCRNCAVISVGAVDRDSNQASYSNFGSRDMNGNGIPLTVWAPGGDAKGPMCPNGTRVSTYSDSITDPLNKLPFTRIWQAMPDNSYGYGEVGTSLAAPFVTGVAGLMLSVNPNLTAAQLKTIIHDTAAFTGNSDPEGNPIRLLNAFQAVQQTQNPSPIITLPATSITSTSAVLNGSINSNGTAGFAVFQIGTDPNSITGTSAGFVVAGTSTTQNFSTTLTLNPNTTYYYRMVFCISNCNFPTQIGNVQSFITLSFILTTLPATSITSLGAQLNGSINPNGTPGCAGFEIGTTPNLNNPSNAAGVNSPVSATFVAQQFLFAFNPFPTGLSGTTYYYRIVFFPNCLGGPGGAFPTGSIASVTIPPVISNLSVSTTATSATITFTTSVPSSSQIFYGTNGIPNNSDAASPTSTTHIHTLTNLASGTVYTFYVSVYFGQLVNSSAQTFTTQ